jgi:sugar lactone lactonase YvrE
MIRTRGTFRAPSVVLAAAILVAGCDPGPAAVEADFDGMAAAAAPLTGAPPGPSSTVHEVVAFDPVAGEYPEGIAVSSDGGVYVGLTGLGEIRRIDRDGSMTTIVTIPLEEGDLGVLGLTFRADGTLYAAVLSSSSSVHGVWRIDANAQAMHIAGTEAMGFPNDLAFDRRGELYITDSALGAVWRLSPDGSFALWAQDALLEGTGDFGLGVPIGANGIVFLPGRSGGGKGQGGQAGRLLVANTEVGRLVEITVRPNGDAGATRLAAEDGALVGLDGIAADPHGRIYGAVNVGNQVVAIDAAGAVQTVATGLDFPAGLAFGTSGRHRHSLFVTNFALINEVDPSPGVVRLDMGPPGRR